MGPAGMEVVGVLCPTGISRYFAVFLPDLVPQLVEVDQIENLSHSRLNYVALPSGLTAVAKTTSLRKTN
jgi:hypothetical protein